MAAIQGGLLCIFFELATREWPASIPEDPYCTVWFFTLFTPFFILGGLSGVITIPFLKRASAQGCPASVENGIQCGRR